jgi:DNA-directed RNA polymerase sigma subunit (sigma70/sigma32)
MSSRGVSIDKPIGDAQGATIGSIIPDGALRQDVAMERTQNSEAILTALSSFVDGLKPNHADILRGRVINELLGEEPRCAKSFGVTKQRVGQIEKQLRSKLADHFTRSFGADGVKSMIRASF